MSLGEAPDSGVGAAEEKILRFCVRGEANQNDPGPHIAIIGMESSPFFLLKEGREYRRRKGAKGRRRTGRA
jgi:hypothetical protein